MNLTHYIVVRRDLLIGEVAAQVAHAAGELFYKFGVQAAARASEESILRLIRSCSYEASTMKERTP